MTAVSWRLLKGVFPLACVLGLFAPIARADDGWVEAVGGCASLLKGHPTIRMQSEYVHIQAPAGKVRAKFIFVNDGPATDVTMGFPEEGRGSNKHLDSQFLHFTSYVDGKKVKCKLMPGKSDDDEMYSYWWVKKVHFNAKQTVVVVVEYEGTESGDTSGAHFLPYTLETGASWKGNIGYARIVADIGAIKNQSIRGFPEKFKVIGNQLIWEFRNLEPSEKTNTDCVGVEWYDGFKNINFNGVDVSNEIWPVMEKEYAGIWPKLDHGDLTAPIEAIARWVGGAIERKGDARILSWTGADRMVLTVVARDRSTLLVATTKNRTLLSPASLKKLQKTKGSDRLVVRVGPVIRALGGEAYYDAKSFTYRIKLKGAVPRWKQEEEKRWKK